MFFKGYYYQNEKSTYSLQENSYVLTKRLIYRIYKGLLKLSNKNFHIYLHGLAQVSLTSLSTSPPKPARSGLGLTSNALT